MLSRLIKGTAGHPHHPPLTDAAIGMYTLAAGLAVIGYAGGLGDAAGKAMWLALIGGLILTIPTALTGLADWLEITRGSPMWRTATLHLGVMLSATAAFAFAAWQQWDGWHSAAGVTTAGVALTLLGFVTLTVGGWLGGTIVFVHGMRVISDADLPTSRAVSPGGVEAKQGES